MRAAIAWFMSPRLSRSCASASFRSNPIEVNLFKSVWLTNAVFAAPELEAPFPADDGLEKEDEEEAEASGLVVFSDEEDERGDPTA